MSELDLVISVIETQIKGLELIRDGKVDITNAIGGLEKLKKTLEEKFLIEKEQDRIKEEERKKGLRH